MPALFSIIDTPDVTPVPSSESLHWSLERLSLEAGVVANVSQAFSGVFPAFHAFFDNFKQAFIGIDTHEPDAVRIRLSSQESAVIAYVKMLSWVDEAETLIQVPESYQGNFITYIQWLDQLTSGLYNETLGYLKDYERMVSSFVTNRDSHLSLDDRSDAYRRIASRRLEIQDSLKHFFPSQTGRSVAKLGSVMDRFGDFEPLIRSTNQLLKKNDARVLQAVQEESKRVAQILDVILKDVRDSKLTTISGPAALNISTGSKELALWISLVSVIYYNVMTISKSVQHLVDQFTPK